jgi:hypothetical protein
LRYNLVGALHCAIKELLEQMLITTKLLLVYR